MTSNQTHDAAAKLNDLRRRVLEGEQLSKEEIAEAIRLLRARREVTEQKKQATEIDLDSLFK